MAELKEITNIFDRFSSEGKIAFFNMMPLLGMLLDHFKEEKEITFSVQNIKDMKVLAKDFGVDLNLNMDEVVSAIGEIVNDRILNESELDIKEID